MTKISFFVLTTIILISGILPGFAEVSELQLDKNSYSKGDFINASGTVTEDSSGLVTIVLRDPNDKFVLLSQAFIKDDDSFEKIIPITEKFEVFGSHNATAFILNMTAGKTQSFDLVSSPREIIGTHELEQKFPDADLVFKSTAFNEPEELIKPEIIEPPPQKEKEVEKQTEVIETQNSIASFVDRNKDPQYYLDRYYNESVYKSWFDRNYPDLTIEEAVGYSIPTQTNFDSKSDFENMTPKIIPEAQASTISTPISNVQNNSDFAPLVLTIGGLAILFGAVYGIKRKVDTNSKSISINKNIIREKIISPIIDSNPMGIITTRLAKGEITIEEYEILKQKLEKNSKQ